MPLYYICKSPFPADDDMYFTQPEDIDSQDYENFKSAFSISDTDSRFSTKFIFDVYILHHRYKSILQEHFNDFPHQEWYNICRDNTVVLMSAILEDPTGKTDQNLLDLFFQYQYVNNAEYNDTVTSWVKFNRPTYSIENSVFEQWIKKAHELPIWQVQGYRVVAEHATVPTDVNFQLT
jgi:hypothetical protein